MTMPPHNLRSGFANARECEQKYAERPGSCEQECAAMAQYGTSEPGGCEGSGYVAGGLWCRAKYRERSACDGR